LGLSACGYASSGSGSVTILTTDSAGHGRHSLLTRRNTSTGELAFTAAGRHNPSASPSSCIDAGHTLVMRNDDLGHTLVGHWRG